MAGVVYGAMSVVPFKALRHFSAGG